MDRAFVNDITADPDDATIVRAIVGLGHNLNLKIVAEGVETLEQLQFLRRGRLQGPRGLRRFLRGPSPSSPIS